MMSTVRFQQRTDKTDKNGKAAIRVIYQIGGQRKYFPTTLKCLPANWNAKDQLAFYISKQTAKKNAPETSYELFLTNSEVTDFNVKLNDFLSDIRDIEKRFSLDKVVYTPQMVIDALNNLRQPESKKEDPVTSVTAFIKKFVQDSISTHKAGTLKAYTGLANHLVAFEKYCGQKASFENMDIPYLRAFHSFLSESKSIINDNGTEQTKAMNNITSAKQLSTLKTLLNYARTDYKIPVNPDYRDYKVARKDSDFEVITLTNDEFLTLYNFDLKNNKKLAQVRDVFCFSCTTGLRYSDLAQLRREHIRLNMIRMTAAKTGQRLEIPLNAFSAAILEKYKEMHLPLPIISNQKTNDYLKELCKLAEINTPIEIIREYGVKKVSNIYKKHELISIHTGRKTFITLSLQKGMATQDVMALSAHTTYKSFKRYVDVPSDHKQAVMRKAWGTLENNNL